MIKEILIVDSLIETIRAWGIEALDNTILQELRGNYWFVDVDKGCSSYESAKEIYLNKIIPCDCEYCTIAIWECPAGYSKEPFIEVDCKGCTKCLKPIPLKLAHLIMQFIAFQRNSMMVSIPTEVEKPPKLRAYIPAGKSFNVEKSDEPAEIPAELGVIHFEG